MLRIDVLILLILAATISSSARLKYRSHVKENVDLFHTITSLDQMLDVNYQQSIEFLNPNAPYATYFLVDGQKLRTSRLIDREEFCRIKLCENSRCYPCEIEMDFVLKEQGQSRDILSLILTVEDVNEFRPQFRDQTIQLNISEGVPVGHILPVPSAIDKDGEDDELIYSLDKTIKIPFDLISFGSNQIALNVTEPLDRETIDLYELRITVSDQGNLSTTIPVDVFINDINDNVPIFNQSTPYVINLSENTLPSMIQAIFRLQAIDQDAGENSRVTYHFSSQVSELIRQTFQLNSQTGELYLIRSLDYEEIKEYRIQITAQDAGPVSVPVYAVVLVLVEDENDNKPSVTIRISEYFQSHDQLVYISEETPKNTLLMHVIVQDVDSGLNGKVRCWIESSDKLSFNITNNIQQMFAVYIGETFDREKKANHSIQIVVEDQGPAIHHRTVRPLLLVITDVNDCAPKFSEKFYNLSVFEEENYRQALVRFQASDEDLHENGQVSYEIIGEPYHSLFHLNSKTGELFLRKKLDRESQSNYKLTIRARDYGIYPQALFTDVFCSIEVLDQNEFPPVFEKKLYQFHHVPEDLSINTSIGFVRATDGDGNSIRYSSISSEIFIHPSTGELYLSKILDYDDDPTCRHLIATAEDSHRWNSSCEIEICLQPVNEYPPEIRPESRLIHVNMDNTSLIHLQSVDRDYSPSASISYRFQPSSLCNLTFLSNGSIYLPRDESCLGILDLSLTIDDNDQYPSSKSTNETIRLIFYSNQKTLHEVLLKNNVKWSGQIITFLIIFTVILFILTIVLVLIYRQYRKSSLICKTSSRISKDQFTFPEKHDLLSDVILNRTHIKLPIPTKATLNSETSSSYNDSCYGSSDIDLHPHHHSPNQLNGKVLLASNENYIIFCKDHSTANDEMKYSPSEKNANVISRYQSNKRSGLAPLYSTQVESSSTALEFFHNDYECRKVLGSTSSFHCRNITPVDEYYL